MSFRDDGDDASLQQPTNPFSDVLKTADAIRKRERKKGKLNNSDRQTLRDIYHMVFHVAHHADPTAFREKLPKKEFEACLNHAVEILRHITNDSKWINTGSLLKHDRYMMGYLVALLEHQPAVELIFDEIKVLETISDMMAALEVPPSVEYADIVISLVEHIHECCRCRFDKEWKAEKIFKKLESTGILPNYLRCAAIEGSVLDMIVSDTFQELLSCTAYVQKRFQEGTPCGDTVRAILDGSDRQSSPPSARMLPYMISLVQLSTVPAELSEGLNHGNVCHHCENHGSDKALMRCSKCLKVAYCSKECQRADWKEHKKICRAPTKQTRSEKNEAASRNLLQIFAFEGYVHIMVRMLEESDKAGGLSFDEMVLELDVCPDASGTIPFMKDPPEFHIVPVAKYLDGTRFFARREFESKAKRKECQRNFLASLKEQQSLRKATELVCVVHHDSSYSFQRVQRMEDDSLKHVFCQEALEAFRSLIVDNNLWFLWQIFQSDRARHYMMCQMISHPTLERLFEGNEE